MEQGIVLSVFRCRKGGWGGNDEETEKWAFFLGGGREAGLYIGFFIFIFFKEKRETTVLWKKSLVYPYITYIF